METPPIVHPKDVVACTHYPLGGTPQPITVEAISDVLASDADGFVWIALYEPAEETLRKVQEEFDLHDLEKLSQQ